MHKAGPTTYYINNIGHKVLTDPNITDEMMFGDKLAIEILTSATQTFKNMSETFPITSPYRSQLV